MRAVRAVRAMWVMRAVLAIAMYTPAMIEAADPVGCSPADIAANVHWPHCLGPPNCTRNNFWEINSHGDDTSNGCRRFSCMPSGVVTKEKRCDDSDPDCGCCESDAGVEECKLLGGATENVVQGFCALTGFLSLVLKKRLLDDKKGVDRSWSVWGMDVTKQATSGVAAHVAGLINSSILNDSTGAVGNACSWYFVAFTFDTTCGVMVGYVLLNILQQAARKYNMPSLQNTGNYKPRGERQSATGQQMVDIGCCKPDVDGSIWIKQMLSWCLITLVARGFIGVALYLSKGFLQDVAQAIANPFNCHPTVFLVLVMLGCPLGMNALQLVRRA